jgi:hypothetical protein
MMSTLVYKVYIGFSHFPDEGWEEEIYWEA